MVHGVCASGYDEMGLSLFSEVHIHIHAKKKKKRDCEEKNRRSILNEIPFNLVVVIWW